MSKPGISKLFSPFLLFSLLSCLVTPRLVYSAQLEPYSETDNTNFSLPDLNGNTQALQDYRGKVVLINFWASWCLPCLQEMPSMKRLADSLNAQNFAILTLNTSDSANRAKETLKRLQLDMTVLLDRDGKTFKAWRGHVLPTSYLLDHSGRVRYRVVGPMDWDDAEVVLKIKQLIQQQPGT